MKHQLETPNNMTQLGGKRQRDIEGVGEKEECVSDCGLLAPPARGSRGRSTGSFGTTDLDLVARKVLLAYYGNLCRRPWERACVVRAA